MAQNRRESCSFGQDLEVIPHFLLRGNRPENHILFQFPHILEDKGIMYSNVLLITVDMAHGLQWAFLSSVQVLHMLPTTMLLLKFCEKRNSSFSSWITPHKQNKRKLVHFTKCCKENELSFFWQSWLPKVNIYSLEAGKIIMPVAWEYIQFITSLLSSTVLAIPITQNYFR